MSWLTWVLGAGVGWGREIGHHYVPPGLPWFVTMWGPLAVYRWTWEKAPELGPLWFGYWKSTDHFLGLHRCTSSQRDRC